MENLESCSSVVWIQIPHSECNIGDIRGRRLSCVVVYMYSPHYNGPTPATVVEAGVPEKLHSCARARNHL